MIPEVLKYNLVVPALSRQTRNLIVVGCFILGLGLSYLLKFFVLPEFPILITLVLYIIFLFFISKPVMKVRVIGEIIMDTNNIQLSNIESNFKRTIEIKSVKCILIKKGMAANLVLSKWKKTLIIEITLNDGEIVEAQVGKRRNDLEMAEDITKYCEALNISVNRRL